MFKKCAQQNSHNVVAAVLNPLRTLLNLVLSVRRCQDERNLRQIRQGFAIKNIRKTFARIFSEYRNIFAVFRNLPPSFSQLHHFYVTRPDRILRSVPNTLPPRWRQTFDIRSLPCKRNRRRARSTKVLCLCH